MSIYFTEKERWWLIDIKKEMLNLINQIRNANEDHNEISFYSHQIGKKVKIWQ